LFRQGRGEGGSDNSVDARLFFAKSSLNEGALEIREFCSEESAIPINIAPVATQKCQLFFHHYRHPREGSFA